MVRDSVPNGLESTEQVAKPASFVFVWQRGLSEVVKDTHTSGSGVPPLVRVALNQYCWPVPERVGGDAVKVVGVCPTVRTMSTVLDWNLAVPE